ncbi:MAG: hypothetical protein H5U37_03480 [Caldisericia bacterium]|nr:hypothetical protein [Caldisericia bacterium]
MYKFIKFLKIFIKYFILLSFIFTPYHLYRISLFRLSNCFQIFLKLNKYEIKIVPPLYRNFKIETSDEFEKYRIEFIYLPVKCTPELKIENNRNFLNLNFSFMPYIKLPDTEEYANFNICITCIVENIKDDKYQLTPYIPPDIDEKYLSIKFYDVQKIKEHEKYVKKRVIEFLNDTEVIKEDYSSYSIYLKYLYSLPIGNLFWSFQSVPKPHNIRIPPIFVYLILIIYGIYTSMCHLLSIIWLPIFLLIPKSFIIIFFWIWLCILIIIMVYLWRKETRIIFNKIKKIIHYWFFL